MKTETSSISYPATKRRVTPRLLLLMTGGLASVLVVVLAWRAWCQTTSADQPHEDAAAEAVVPELVRAFDLLAEQLPADELAAFAIQHPAELEQLLARLKSPEEKAAEALAELAVLRPAEYAAKYPRPQPSEQERVTAMDAPAYGNYLLTNGAALPDGLRQVLTQRDLAALVNYAAANGPAIPDALKEKLDRAQDPERLRREAEAAAAMLAVDAQARPLPPPNPPEGAAKP